MWIREALQIGKAHLLGRVTSGGRFSARQSRRSHLQLNRLDELARLRLRHPATHLNLNGAEVLDELLGDSALEMPPCWLQRPGDGGKRALPVEACQAVPSRKPPRKEAGVGFQLCDVLLAKGEHDPQPPVRL